MKKSKKLVCISSLLFSGLLIFTISVLNINYLKESNSENETFTLNFDSKDATKDDSFYKKISTGDYYIYFSQKITCDIEPSCWRTLAKDDYIYVTDSSSPSGNKGINGLASIEVTFFDGSSNSLKISYGWEPENYVTSDILSDSSLYYFNYLRPTYFRIDNVNNNKVNIKSLVINYSCQKTNPPSGDGLNFRRATNCYYVEYADWDVTNIIIPEKFANENVVGIDYNAFKETILTSVFIPNTITSIGDYAFYSCSSLVSVTLPNSVTSISSYQFYGCTSLTFINIPSNITVISDGAFYGCKKLENITYEGTTKDWSTKVIQGSSWHDGCPTKVVHCSDGDIDL